MARKNTKRLFKNPNQKGKRKTEKKKITMKGGVRESAAAIGSLGRMSGRATKQKIVDGMRGSKNTTRISSVNPDRARQTAQLAQTQRKLITSGSANNAKIGSLNPGKVGANMQRLRTEMQTRIVKEVTELLKLIEDPDMVRRFTLDPDLIKIETHKLQGKAQLKALEIGNQFTGSLKKFAGENIKHAAHLDKSVKKKIKEAEKQAKRAKKQAEKQAKRAKRRADKASKKASKQASKKVNTGIGKMKFGS